MVVDNQPLKKKKTWTLDSELDHGRDYGLDYGLHFGLDFRLESRIHKLKLTFASFTTFQFLIAYILLCQRF